MFLKRKTRLIPETFAYAIGVACVAAIALVREVNLLVFITGLLLVPLLINAYLARRSLWKVAIRRRLPEGLCAGESGVVEIEVERSSRLGAVWTIVLTDHLQLVEPASLAQLEHPETITLLAHGKRDRITKAVYRITVPRRGKYRFGPIDAATRYPLGFIESRLRFSAEAEWLVLPRIGLLLPQWRHDLDAHRQGEQKSYSRRGFIEGDFHGLRQWQDGDSRRWIHWRTSARSAELMVRQFERQQSQDLILLADLWRPAKADVKDVAAVELAVSFIATAIDDLCRAGTHRLCVYIQAQKPLVWTGVTSPVALTELLEALAVIESHDQTTEIEIPPEFRRVALQGASIVRLSTRSLDEEGDVDPLAAWGGDDGGRALSLNVRHGDLNPYFTDPNAS
jgi:uncharacterized protein (DUF58 family)